jgi:hypothetical protein
MALKHGRVGTYTNHGCHCQACRDAWSACHAAWVSRQAPLPPEDQRHGTVNGYKNYRCRCDRCRAAAAEDRRKPLSEVVA